MAFQPDAETVVMAVPMIGLLIMGYFRLDEYFSRPANAAHPRRGFSHRGRDGAGICVEPDGRVERRGQGKASSPVVRESGEMQKRNGTGIRVTVE